MEGGVVGREDGEVFVRVDVRVERSIDDHAAGCGEVEGGHGVEEIYGRDEEGVDYVDDTAAEG